MSQSARVWRVILSAKLLVAFAAISSLHLEFDSGQFRSAYANWPPNGEVTLSSHFSTWDGAHYLRLSAFGYKAGSTFYPLWPELIGVATRAIRGNAVFVSLILANGLSVVGFWLFYRLVERKYGAAIGLDALVIMLAFPGALFFSFSYTESLYLVILMLFFWGLEMERWSRTAVSGLLLPLARPLDVFVVVPLAWNCLKRFRHAIVQHSPPTQATPDSVSTNPAAAMLRQLRNASPCLPLVCPVIGYAAYFLLMFAWTGNAFEGFVAQRSYPNSPSIRNMFDFPHIMDALAGVHSFGGMMDGALDRLFFLLFLALLPLIWRLDRLWFFYTLPAGLVPALTSWFMSYRRYSMMLFPVFVVLAKLLSKSGSRLLFWYYVALLAAVQIWAVTQFVNFKWAG